MQDFNERVNSQLKVCLNQRAVAGRNSSHAITMHSPAWIRSSRNGWNRLITT